VDPAGILHLAAEAQQQPSPGVTEATLLGFASLMTALAALGSTVMALRKNRSEEYEKTAERLRECRKQVEELSSEMHDLRMKEIARGEPPPQG
jgi:hypothetical protein